eukprot:4928932-Ditylum_brightwellii.AAC.1
MACQEHVNSQLCINFTNQTLLRRCCHARVFPRSSQAIVSMQRLLLVTVVPLITRVAIFVGNDSSVVTGCSVGAAVSRK